MAVKKQWLGNTPKYIWQADNLSSLTALFLLFCNYSFFSIRAIFKSATPNKVCYGVTLQLKSAQPSLSLSPSILQRGTRLSIGLSVN